MSGALRSALWVSLACVLLGLLTYAPAVTGRYGRLDDYVYVFQSSMGGLDMMREFMTDGGRPVTAFIMTELFPQIDSVDGLVLMRWAAVVVLSFGAATAAVLTLRLSGAPTRWSSVILALCTGALALSTTAAPSAATWAIIVGGMTAFPTAMASGLWATRSGDRWWWVISGALIAVAAFTYQQVAPVAILAPLLWSANRWARREKVYWSRTLVVGVMVVLSLLANLWFVRDRGGAALERISTATPSERLEWFIDDFLPRTVDLTLAGSSESLAWSMALLLALLLFPAVGGPRHLAGSVGVLLAWLGTSLTVLPAELWASFRLASAAQFVLWVGAAACFSAAVARLPNARLRAGAVGVALAAVTVSLAVAGHRANDYLAAPNEVDWASIECAVDGHGGVSAGDEIELNHYADSTSEIVLMDEYGIIGSSVPWSFTHALWLAEAGTVDREPNFQPAELVLVAPGEGTPDDLAAPQHGGC